MKIGRLHHFASLDQTILSVQVIVHLQRSYRVFENCLARMRAEQVVRALNRVMRNAEKSVLRRQL